jgi:proline racemase
VTGAPEAPLPAPPRGVRVRLTTVDSHTSGQQTRVVVDGAPALEGLPASEARDAIRADYDWIRRLCTLEPRGGRSMFAAVLLPARSPSHVRRVVFADADGYPEMCGHATIGVATTLVDLGEIDGEPPNGELEFALETPCGLIGLRVDVDGGHAVAVSFRNQPSFFLETTSVDSPAGPVGVDIAYGGQWYAFLDARPFGLEVHPRRIGELIAAAEGVRRELAGRVTAADPLTARPPAVGNVVWLDEPTDGADARNVPISPFGAFDRSPCGTATSARLAVLHATGRLAAGEVFRNQGILDTVYEARILAVTEVAGTPAVVPEVTGSAWLTGSLSVWVDPTDPLRDGYLV